MSRGGARKGAGRKLGSKNKVVIKREPWQCSLPTDTAMRAREIQRVYGLTKAELMARLVDVHDQWMKS